MAQSRVQLEIWRTAAEIAAIDPDVVVRLARTSAPDYGLLLKKPGDPTTKVLLTARGGVRLLRDGMTMSWSWHRVFASEPTSYSATVLDAAVWAQGSLPITTSAPAAGALAIDEILNLMSRAGGNLRVANRVTYTADTSRPYLAPLPSFPSVREAVRKQALTSVNFGDRVVLDRLWLISVYGKELAAIDLNAGILHAATGPEQLPVGQGDARKTIRNVVMDLIKREC